MKPHHFLKQISDDAVLAAIAEAEKKSTGRIRVFVSHHKVADPVAAGQHHFHQMGLDQNNCHTDVLIFVAPKSHKFSIIGDEAIHQKCGDQFWTAVTAEMSQYFKQEQWTQALVHGVQKVGDLLAEHFPHPV